MIFSDTNKSLSPRDNPHIHEGAIVDTGDTDVLSDLVSAALAAGTCEDAGDLTGSLARARARAHVLELIRKRDKTSCSRVGEVGTIRADRHRRRRRYGRAIVVVGVVVGSDCHETKTKTEDTRLVSPTRDTLALLARDTRTNTPHARTLKRGHAPTHVEPHTRAFGASTEHIRVHIHAHIDVGSGA